jgi:hypothetical protein
MNWVPPLQGVLPDNMALGLQFFFIVYIPFAYALTWAVGWVFDRCGWFTE